VFLALAVALPVVSAGLYVVKNGVTLTRLADPVAVVQPQVPPMVLEMVARLERRLTEQPADPQGWARLGRAYDVLGKQEEAGQAYAHAHRLAPNDAEILSAYAAHLMAADPINPSPEAVALFRKLHTLDPRHPGALWTLGLLAYKEQKFKEAGKYWERLLKELPADSEVAPAVRQALDAARTQAAEKKK
jgi:cytochrome c-type biogenesis protein CcmH